MPNMKSLKVIMAIIVGCLLLSLTLNFYENNKPLKEKIDEVLKNHDKQYLRTITIYFNNNNPNPYVFYEAQNSILKVVLLGNSAMKRITVKEVIGEISMITDEKKVSWNGVGNNITGTSPLREDS